MPTPIVRTTVELDPQLAAALRQFGFDRGMSNKQVIDAALRKYLPAALLKGGKP